VSQLVKARQEKVKEEDERLRELMRERVRTYKSYLDNQAYEKRLGKV